MLKINLDENDSNALATLESTGAKGIEVQKKVFQYYMDDLSSVNNIDSKANMGLQALARQEAYKTLCEIAEIFFPSEASKIRASMPGTGDGKKPISKWR